MFAIMNDISNRKCDFAFQIKSVYYSVLINIKFYGIKVYFIVC